MTNTTWACHAPCNKCISMMPQKGQSTPCFYPCLSPCLLFHRRRRRWWWWKRWCWWGGLWGVIRHDTNLQTRQITHGSCVLPTWCHKRGKAPCTSSPICLIASSSTEADEEADDYNDDEEAHADNANEDDGDGLTSFFAKGSSSITPTYR